MMRIWRVFGVIAVVAGAALRAGGEDDMGREQMGSIDRVLDAFHEAAAKAEGDRYFEQLTSDAVFLGTDASERWSKKEFEVFARPYFDKGKGWAYESRERQVTVESGGDLAWFDELLENASYGTCRGTGVLRKTAAGWRIAQYSLSIPIPNPLARDFVAGIRAHEQRASSRAVVYLVRHAETCGGLDPRLTPAGGRRACQLWQALRSAGIDRVYATNEVCTQQTVAPTASGLGIPVTIIHKEKTEELLSRVKRDLASDATLIAARSDALAEIVKGLGVTEPVSVGGLFDDLYVVTLRGGAEPHLQHLHYGK